MSQNDKKVIELLTEIKGTLESLDSREDSKEVFTETNKLLDKVEDRVEHSTRQIQSTFDRIHDKVFSFNNIMIGAYLVLATFPSESPKMPLWTVIFPIANLIYLVLIEVRQMKIHRFAAKEEEWTQSDRTEYGKKIHSQTLLSLVALLLSIGCLGYIIYCLFA